MRSTIILATLASVLSVAALQPGDVPVEIAVRSDAYVPSLFSYSTNGQERQYPTFLQTRRRRVFPKARHRREAG